MVRTFVVLLLALMSIVTASRASEEFGRKIPRADEAVAPRCDESEFGPDTEDNIEVVSATPAPNLEEANRRIANAETQYSDDLDLSGLNLREIPPKVFDLVNLKTLNVSANLVSVLPSQISRLGSLENIDATANQLTSLPVEIADLKLNWTPLVGPRGLRFKV